MPLVGETSVCLDWTWRLVLGSSNAATHRPGFQRKNAQRLGTAWGDVGIGDEVVSGAVEVCIGP